jgi:hypothetical protein
MNHIRFTWCLVFACLSLLLITAAACKKSAAISPSATDQATGQANQTNPLLSAEELKQQRLVWNLKTLVEPYEQAGFTNPKWDTAAKLALTEFAHARSNVLETNEPWALIIATNTATAVQAGCKDPMVTYLYIKFAMNQTNSKEAFTEAFYKTASDVDKSSYPAIRKFYASFRALSQYSWANNYPTNQPPEIKDLNHQTQISFNAMLADKTIPSGEIYDACHEVLEMWKGSKTAYPDLYNNCIEPPLFKNWPDASTSWLLKGEANIEMAWQARGGGYANTVTDEGWKSFKEHLNTAGKSLEHAWKLNPKDPRIAVKMMWVELGQGQGGDRMELWFNRAMELDPNDYDACNTKCLYLEPKWYGSIDQMLAFGRECVQTKRWGGQVPLVLVNAHWDIPLYYLEGSEKTNYWTQPEVWPDIKAAYDRFFELNPNAIGYYHNYALYAYRCQQWDALNELIPKLGPVNYAFFGGKDEFDKMVHLAKEHAGKPN